MSIQISSAFSGTVLWTLIRLGILLILIAAGNIASTEILFWPARLDFPAGRTPSCVAIRDLNSDQIPDLAVASYGADNVAVLLGLGDGGFAAATFFGAGDGPYSVAIGDLNRDQVPV